MIYNPSFLRVSSSSLSKMQEEFRIKGGYTLNEKIEKIKHGFKLNDGILNTSYNNLSGGEKTIINLASLVLSEPDVLLLDEPTNHLDIENKNYLQQVLEGYMGTVIIVSHDKNFLKNTTNKLLKIEKQQIITC